MLKTKKKFLMAFLSLTLCAHYSCKKDASIPENNTISEQMYSAGQKSITADIIKTSDGGYLMVGTSYTNSPIEGDIVAIKTDARGVQQWTTSMGKASEMGSGSLNGQTVHYDEEGVKVVEESDGSFTIAGNRTYIAYPNINSSHGVKKHTKIVFYQLSSTGTATSTDGVELKSNDEFTERISDFKIDASSGTSKYILTGYTTNVNNSKPSNNSNTDLTDMLVMSLDNNFNFNWAEQNSAQGFQGSDYGTSVVITPNGYVVTGTTQTINSGAAPSTRFTATLIDKATGTPIRRSHHESQGYDVEGGYSVYDATTQSITFVGNVVGGSLTIAQLDANLSTQYPTNQGFELLTPSSNGAFKASSIAIVPNNGGFVISSTKSDNLGKDICITKVENNFSLSTAAGWPHYYRANGGINTSEYWAGPVVPTVDANGTLQYAYTGTFNANTFTSQIGWVLF